MIFAFRLNLLPVVCWESSSRIGALGQASQWLLRRFFTQTRVQCLHETENCARLLMKFSSIFPCCRVSCRDFYRRLSLLVSVRKLCHSCVGGKHQLSIDSKNPCSIHCEPFIEHDKTKPQTSLMTPRLVNENEQLKKMKAKYCTTISERNLSQRDKFTVKFLDRRASCRETDVT